MNIEEIKKVLDKEGIWHSSLVENPEMTIDEVTTIPHLCNEMYKKLFIITTGNVREAEQAVSDWHLFANVILDTGCTSYLSKLTPHNLLLVYKDDIGKVIGSLNEAMRR